MEEVRQRLGPIGVLINNAANDQRQDADEVSEEDWDRAMAVNLKHQFFAAQIARRSMRELGGGAIVNFSSTAFMLGIHQLSVYSAAKAAVVGLTMSLAREFGPDNIRVNAIAPGLVVTERQRRLWMSEADLANFRAAPMSHPPQHHAGRHGAGGAVSRRRRQCDDHQAMHPRRCRFALNRPPEWT